MSSGSSSSSSVAWPSDRVRATFIDFFAQKKAHTAVPSGPVVPHDDPTLLFTNAGMNQFKDIFTGQIDPSAPFAELKRAVDSQKCIRAGGKHNDLDDVGKDTYHHTFFEMLGNWSFGDFFKQEAIDWAMELLVDVYGLDKTRMYATYFQGDDEANVPCDNEARELWLKHLPAERVLPFDKKDNFWEMGDTGPCGPCTEIHYDLIGNRDGASLVNADDPTLIEIWNLVFMQFNRGADGKLTPLPAKHVDTGAGLERLVAVLQDKKSNYDTDVFTDIFAEIQKVTGAEPYTAKLGKEDTGTKDMAYRVVADHIRTLCVALADGAVPDSDGRGYVLRRIVRRAVRFGTQCLNAPPGFFHALVPAVVDKLGDTFPELRKKAAHVVRIIKREEELFLRTLEKGTKQLNKVLDKLEANQKTVLDGATAFNLYSTFGFPPDLTELMCDERGVSVEKDGYEAAFAAFKVQRSTGGEGGAERPSLGVHQTDELKNTRKLAPTDDAAKYDTSSSTCEAKLVAVFDGAQFVDSVGAASPPPAAQGIVGLVFERTNFYAEAGGQVGDVGVVRVSADGAALFDISDTQSHAGYVLHTGTLRKGADGAQLSVGATLVLERDDANRELVTINHTTTHMLNWALTKVLGGHVDQKGSKVVAEQFRFDFSNDGAVKPEQLQRVDELVSDLIKRDAKIYSKVVDLEQARGINGLKAVFGEKYPDPVRVVSIGAAIDDVLAAPTKDWGTDFSIEFCGGTHLTRSSEARAYTTVSEGAIAQGIRRVVGLTHTAAETAHATADEMEARIAALVKSGEIVPRDVRVALDEDIQSAQLPLWRAIGLRKSLEELTRAAFAASKKKTGAAVALAKTLLEERALKVKAEAPKFLVEYQPDLCGAINAMRPLGDGLAELGVPTLVVSVAEEGKKAGVVAFACVPKDCVGKINASDWVKAAVEPFGGRGGGRPFQAQATHAQLDLGKETAAAAEEFAKAKLTV